MAQKLETKRQLRDNAHNKWKQITDAMSALDVTASAQRDAAMAVAALERILKSLREAIREDERNAISSDDDEKLVRSHYIMYPHAEVVHRYGGRSLQMRVHW